jgi:hypothetical protein
MLGLMGFTPRELTLDEPVFGTGGVLLNIDARIESEHTSIWAGTPTPLVFRSFSFLLKPLSSEKTPKSLLHTHGVTGSSPVASTISFKYLSRRAIRQASEPKTGRR